MSRVKVIVRKLTLKYRGEIWPNSKDFCLYAYKLLTLRHILIFINVYLKILIELNVYKLSLFFI